MASVKPLWTPTVSITTLHELTTEQKSQKWNGKKEMIT